MPKKPKLTPEEKKKLKREKKEAKKLYQIQLKRQREHENLGRQQKYGSLTMHLHEKNWKRLLMNITLPKMKDELEFAWKNFERVVDVKDFTISLLMDEIENSEEEYMRNIRNHIGKIDQFLELFQDRIDELQFGFKKDIDDIQMEHEREFSRLNAAQEEWESTMKTMLYRLEQERKMFEKDLKGYYVGKMDEERSNLAEVISNLIADSDRAFGVIHSRYKKFLQEHIETNKQKRSVYDVQLNQVIL